MYKHNSIKYQVIAINSKPLDFLNTIEYLHNQKIDTVNLLIIIIGRGTHQKAVKQISEQYKIATISIENPELYSVLVPRINTLRIPSQMKDILRIIIGFTGKFYWYLSLLRISFRLKNLECNELILDAWRNKCAVSLLIKFRNLTIIDGGQSTLTFKLVDKWKQFGPPKAIELYIEEQALYSPDLQSRNDFISRIKYALSSFFTRLPFPIKFLLNRRLSSSSIKLFTSYMKSNQNDSITIKNDYAYSIKKVNFLDVQDRILIIGHPSLIGLSKQIEHANKIIESSKTINIHYQLHPADCNKMSESKNYKKKIEQELGKYTFSYSCPKLSLEMDIISNSMVPSHIIIYNSSAVSWLKTVLKEKVEIIINNNFLESENVIMSNKI